MVTAKYPVAQTDPPRSPRDTLPTMYDLPSDNPQEPGLPDEFHDLQPQLLSATLRLSHYSSEQLFTGTDLNLYYDIRHLLRYKRPDWFLALGVPRLYDGTELRMSYVIWQEGISPFVVVELLSPGTEREDLGQSQRQGDQPPTKWEVYEQILRVPYYIVFDRYNDRLRAFSLQAGHYQELALAEPKVWMPELEVGLGLWQGRYQGIDRQWLRWYGGDGTWLSTDAELERQRAEQAEAELATLRQRLRERGIDPDELLMP
ncbi:Uma2 family endonuclease [Pantanalinema rosaneae CENA516]|uniref:Uma2 family endonuclease n=1 Tax=Pantanalinema rosaneae TaxID=1620701 RepID=UPI003D6F7BD2